MISTAIPLPVENIDTDQIIPARFLKLTMMKGWGEYLFRDWRFRNDDPAQPNKDFVLNNPLYKGRILLAGKNFGCGSSREHAVWAIKEYGFDAIISSGFADIFYNNALNNFLLPVTVSETLLQQLLNAVVAAPDTAIDINLDTQTIECTAAGLKAMFEINAYKKQCMLHGYDNIDYLVSLRTEIEAFEKHQSQYQF